MKDNKRQIIIEEIKQWRRSKLLPEQYCNFLLNLYEDENAAGESGAGSPNIWSHLTHAPLRKKQALTVLTVGLFCLAFISIVVFYFNMLSVGLQIVIFVGAILLLFLWGHYLRGRRNTASAALIGCAAILSLFAGPYLFRLHDVQLPYLVILHVLFCAVVWVGIGKWLRIQWLMWCGLICTFLCLSWFAYDVFRLY